MKAAKSQKYACLFRLGYVRVAGGLRSCTPAYANHPCATLSQEWLDIIPTGAENPKLRILKAAIRLIFTFQGLYLFSDVIFIK